MWREHGPFTHGPWGRRRRAGAGSAQRARAAPLPQQPCPSGGSSQALPWAPRRHKRVIGQERGRGTGRRQTSLPSQLPSSALRRARVTNPAAAPGRAEHEPDTAASRAAPGPLPEAPGPRALLCTVPHRPQSRATRLPQSHLHQPLREGLGGRRETKVKSMVRGFSVGFFLYQQAIPVPVTINHG